MKKYTPKILQCFKRELLQIIILVSVLLITSCIPDEFYCSDNFINIYEDSLKKGDNSVCSTFGERGYQGFEKEDYACVLRDSKTTFTDEDCFIGIAKATQNISNCDEVENIGISNVTGTYYDRDRCFSEIHNLTKNINWCDFTTNREDCLAFIAKETNDITLCRSVLDNITTDCLRAISIKSNDSGICDGYNDKWKRNRCLLNFARTTGNKEVCLLIGEDRYRETCLKVVK